MNNFVGTRGRLLFEGFSEIPSIPFISLILLLIAAYSSRTTPTAELTLWIVLLSASISSIAGFAFHQSLAPRSRSNSMAMEKSAILPSAGGHANSAAPTVQSGGKPMEVRTDCPQDSKSK